MVVRNKQKPHSAMNMEEATVGNRIGVSKDVITRACCLATKAHKSSSGKSHYISDKARMSSLETVVIFAFAGFWDVSDWFSHSPFGHAKINLNLFPSLKTVGGNEPASVNKAFLQKFEAILANTSLRNEVEKAVIGKQQIVFTGHSSGATLAIFATLWFLEIMNQRRANLIPPHCITFGSPLVGDGIFTHALKRQHWSGHFTHFITQYDIIPRIFLSPRSSIEQELQPILHYFNPKSPLFTSDAIAKATEAVKFFLTVMRNASAVATHAACKFMGCTNLLLETLRNFVELSPYRPFGTYIFITSNGKLVVVENPDAILQLLFYSLQLGSESEWKEIAQIRLKEHPIYETEILGNLQMQNITYFDNLEDVPLSAEDSVYGLNSSYDAALNDLGLSIRARLCMRAAGELEKQKARNQTKINSKKSKIEEVLNSVEKYQANCELKKVGYYDAFKIQKHTEDFNTNIRRLELAGIWDEIMDMLKRNELPDEFEEQKEWIELGTRYRRLIEPLDIANYYRHLKNEDTGPYMDKGRPTRYKYTQKWLEHTNKKEGETIPESCFWAEVEELVIITCNVGSTFEDVEDRVFRLEENVSRWVRNELLGKYVFLNDSTFAQWWKSLPIRHKSVSCIRDLIV